MANPPGVPYGGTEGEWEERTSLCGNIFSFNHSHLKEGYVFSETTTDRGNFVKIVFPQGPSTLYFDENGNDGEGIWTFDSIQGNSSWLFGVVPKAQLHIPNPICSNGQRKCFVLRNTATASGHPEDERADIHLKRIRITDDKDNKKIIMEAIDPENEEITKTWSFDYNGQMEDGFMVGILGFRNTTFQVPLECFGSCIKG